MTASALYRSHRQLWSDLLVALGGSEAFLTRDLSERQFLFEILDVLGGSGSELVLGGRETIMAAIVNAAGGSVLPHQGGFNFLLSQLVTALGGDPISASYSSLGELLAAAVNAADTGGGGDYAAKAVRFEAGAYLARGGPLTGVLNSPKGTVFYWFRSDPAFTIGQNIIASIPSYGVNPYDEGGAITFVSDGTNSWNFNNALPSPPPDVDDGDWYGIARSWDTTDADSANWTYAVVVGESSVAPIIGSDAAHDRVGVGFSAKWVDDDFYIMGDGSEDVFREVAQMWADPGVFMNAAQLIAAFWGADNKPKSLGANGEGATGTPPAIYCDGDASVWADNLGTAGPFAGQGDPIINATTSPSD